MPKPEDNPKSILNISWVVTINHGSFIYIAHQGTYDSCVEFMKTFRGRPRINKKSNRRVATLWHKIAQVRELNDSL